MLPPPIHLTTSHAWSQCSVDQCRHSSLVSTLNLSAKIGHYRFLDLTILNIILIVTCNVQEVAIPIQISNYSTCTHSPYCRTVRFFVVSRGQTHFLPPFFHYDVIGRQEKDNRFFLPTDDVIMKKWRQEMGLAPRD